MQMKMMPLKNLEGGIRREEGVEKERKKEREREGDRLT